MLGVQQMGNEDATNTADWRFEACCLQVFTEQLTVAAASCFITTVFFFFLVVVGMQTIICCRDKH